MKKLLAISLVAFVTSMASAVTMQWAANSVAFNGSTIKNSTSVTGYLLATDALAASYKVDDKFAMSTIGTQVDTKNKTSAVAKLGGTWTIDTTTYDNGDAFAILLTYNDGKDTYYNLASSLVKISGMSLDPPVNAANTTGSFNYGKGTDGTLTAGGGWVKAASVPEPATGALALAGLALLFRRRRA